MRAGASYRQSCQDGCHFVVLAFEDIRIPVVAQDSNASSSAWSRGDTSVAQAAKSAKPASSAHGFNGELFSRHDCIDMYKVGSSIHYTRNNCINRIL